jgi:hypothetical protein
VTQIDLAEHVALAPDDDVRGRTLERISSFNSNAAARFRMRFRRNGFQFDREEIDLHVLLEREHAEIVFDRFLHLLAQLAAAAFDFSDEHQRAVILRALQRLRAQRDARQARARLAHAGEHPERGDQNRGQDPIDVKNMKTFGDCTNASWNSRGSSRMTRDATSGASRCSSAKLTI